MQLNVLGPLDLGTSQAPGGPLHAVRLGPPKQRAVLALLAMHADRVVPADTIVDALWTGRAPANPLGSVQVYVSHLRRLLEPHRGGRPPGVLVSAADGYGLMTGDLKLDVREMEASLQQARELAARGSSGDAVRLYDDVLALWRGDTYADVRTERWAQPEIARVEELRLTACEERAAALLDDGRPAEVITAMEAQAGAHPLREHVWELLALAYAHANRQADALGALRRVRGVLADELGLDPSPRLRQLEEAILRQEVGAPSRTPAPLARRPARRQVFVGREAQLRELRGALSSSTARLVIQLVEGEPGVGKSTLVEQFVAGSGVPSMVGRSPDHETAPALWPWEQVLTQLVTARPDLPRPTSIGALLDDTAVSAPAYDAQGARLRLFDDVSRLLATAAPLVVVLEDLHAADRASLGLLEHLATTEAPGLLVIGTFRRHEASNLTGTLARLSRAGARRMPLDGLNNAEVRHLVEVTIGVDVGEQEAVALLRRTAGNPFFITELVQSGGAVPAGVRDVVLSRVAALGEPTRVVLEAAAVVGDEAEAWLIAEVAGISLGETVDALEAAVAAGLVRPVGQRLSVRFTHALVVDALLEGRSALWRAAAAERCAAALTRTRGHLEEYHGAIARHWLAAAELGPQQARSAAEFCARAGRSAMNRHAADDAVTFWQEAVAAAELGGFCGTDQFEHRLGLAQAWYASGNHEEGYAAVTSALAAAEDDPEDVIRAADVSMAQGIWVPFLPNVDPVELRTALDAALTALPRTSPSWALGQACRSVVLAATGGEAHLDAVSQGAVEAAEQWGDPALVRRVLHLRLISLRGPDFVEQRLATSERLRALPDLPEALAVIVDMHVASHLAEHGRIPEAERIIRRLEGPAAGTHNPTLIRQVSSMRIGLTLFASHYDQALILLDTLQETPRSIDAGYFQASELGQRLLIALEQGHLGDFVPLLEEAFARSGIPGFGYTLGFALLARGETRRAAEILRSTSLPARDYTWVAAVMTRLQLAIGVGDLQIVAQCRDLMRPFAGQLLVNGTCTSLYGAWDSHIGEASLALGELRAARQELTAAIQLLERNGAPYWLARARQALGKCW